jgi:hypothetical protein
MGKQELRDMVSAAEIQIGDILEKLRRDTGGGVTVKVIEVNTTHETDSRFIWAKIITHVDVWA